MLLSIRTCRNITKRHKGRNICSKIALAIEVYSRSKTTNLAIDDNVVRIKIYLTTSEYQSGDLLSWRKRFKTKRLKKSSVG